MAALVAVGARVLSLAMIGRGVPDLLVAFRGRLFLLEVKMPREKLTPDQETFHRLWPEVQVVRTVTEALRAIGAAL